MPIPFCSGALPDTLRIGAIGAGGFGLFALQQFLQIPGTQLVAITGTARVPALAMARRFGVTDVHEVDALLAVPDIDLVYIAPIWFPASSQS
jgi:predicted dehydrogenase